MPRLINTSEFAPAERLHAWKAFHNDIFFDLDFSTGLRSSIDGTVIENTLGSIGISNGEASGHRIVRHKSAPARNGQESFLIKFVMAGSIDTTQRHRQRPFKPGEVAIMNAAEHFSCDIGHPTQVTMMKVPCHVLRARLPWIDDACVVDWPSRSSLLNNVAQFVRSINLGIHRRETLASLEENCLDLLSTMLESARRDVAGGENSDEISFFVVRKLRRFIYTNLGRIGLSAADAAASMRISERQVQKLFQREGTTFGQELMAARLDRANAILASAAGQDLSINAISYRCGFASQAHFSSRFRETFDVSPREHRRLARAAASRSLSSDSLEHSDQQSCASQSATTVVTQQPHQATPEPVGGEVRHSRVR